MDTRVEAEQPGDSEPLGIVIRDRQEPQRPPVISAFIWGGKVRPTPALPYGPRNAA
jgi:hypothetical protein